jgi:receptor protein-tyrosine kinase
MNDVTLQMPAAHPERSGAAHRRGPIGSILVDAGRLKAEDVERILRLQSEERLRFGEAGVRLGLLTEADIRFAVSRQFDYAYLFGESSKVSESVIAAYQPFSPDVEAFRALRSQLMLRWLKVNPKRNTFAIVSPAGQEGRSFIVANLAVVFSQLGRRTLIIDADLRQPAQHTLFGVRNGSGLSAALVARDDPVEIESIPGLRDLAVLPSGMAPPNPMELLSRPMFAELLGELRKHFDVVIIDSPPATQYSDAQIIAASADATLVVTRKDKTHLPLMNNVIESLGESGAPVLGTVLNEF